MTVAPSALTWLMLAGAAAFAGTAGSDDSAGHGAARSSPREERSARRPMSRRAAGLLGALGAAVACIACFGAARGAVVSAVAAPIVGLVVRRLHDRAPPSRPSASIALSLDLVSVALRAGQPLDAALMLAADPMTSAGALLLRVGGLLRLGADPVQAWRVVEEDAVLARVAATARRSATSGTRLAGAFERLAAELREEIRAGAQARAHRVGALAAAPLGLCFLPAFVCLGIVPIIVGIAGGVLGG